jgi:serine/threonine protein kinase
MSSRTVAEELFGYKVIALLGEGARSKLYAVKDRQSGATYALKHVIFEEGRDKDDRFLRQVETEWAALKELNHPAIRSGITLKRERPIVKMTEIALVLELIDSSTLEEAPPRHLRDYVRIFAEVAEGLAHMHEKGFVHADMKTGNIMMPEGRARSAHAKIIDLGQSCKTGTVKPRTQGSPGYMAPEQAAKEAIVEATDVYNFGCTMYRALTRDYAETVLVPGESKARAVEEVPATVPVANRVHSVSGPLSDLVSECIRLPIGKRVASMQMVAQRLRAIESQVGDETL